MKLQAVTVCVNYADFFEQTGAANKGIFDKFVVVTDCKDTEVTALCEKFGYECVHTDAFYENGATFNKYAGINEGLKLIDQDAWVLFIDSDIVLQPETVRVLDNLHLDISCLYGIDRVNCIGMDNWQKYKSSKGVLQENWMLTSAGQELGSRLVHYYGHEGENGRFEGWRPLGFFQLCHRSQIAEYPQNSAGADHCDLVFARMWKRSRRHFIPELMAVHLESERNGQGVNWYGRKSAPFKTLDEKLHAEGCTEAVPLIELMEINDMNLCIEGCTEAAPSIPKGRKFFDFGVDWKWVLSMSGCILLLIAVILIGLLSNLKLL